MQTFLYVFHLKVQQTTLALNSAHLQEKMPGCSYVKNAYVVNEWVPQGPSSNHTNIGILSWCAISNVVKETHCLL